MSVTLSPVAGAAAQFLDNSGNVLTGGKLYTYLAGTTTPVSTYTSSTGLTFHSNPIILDAAGRVSSGGEIWLSNNVQYKFVLKDANDVLIGTWDNLVGINSNFVNYTSQEEIIVATAGQTVFNLSTVTYVPGTNSLQVFVDGVNQYDGASYAYIETDATTVTFTAGLHVGALVKFTTAVSVSAGSTNAALVTYDPPFTSSVATTVETKLSEIVSVKDFGAIGDGTTDDTIAINAAINDNKNGATVHFPTGSYKITSPITVPSNVTLQGEGRNFGTTLLPTGCVAFIFDGSLYGGGFVFRCAIKDMLIDATNASGTNLISITSAYNINIENVFIYGTPSAINTNVYMSGCNDLVFRDVIVYGYNSPGYYGFYIDGSAIGGVSVKLYSPDIETCNRAIKTIGSVVLDVFSPYIERCVVGYDHGITDGQANIYGGLISTVNGYGLNIAGPNLTINGTDIDPYQGAVRGGAGIVAQSTTAFPNVSVSNVPRITQTGFLDNTLVNYLTLNPSPAPILDYFRRSFQSTKTLTSGAATNIFQLRNFNNYCKCKLTFHGYLGLAYVIEEYQFIIVNPGSTTSTVANTTILNTSVVNWTVALTLTLVPDAGNGYTTIQATAVTGGVLGTGQPFPLYAELDIVATDSGVAGVYLQ